MNVPNRLPQESARDYALRVLKDNIVSLELKPGAAISENEIALELGLSRTPVREAIIDLAKVSILETVPQRGTYVAKIDPKMVEESRFLRRVLDKAVIEVACTGADRNILYDMEENVHLQEYYLEKQDPDRIFALDNIFHKMIYTAAGKDIIYDMRDTMMIHFDRVRTLSAEAVKDLKIVSDHRAMLEAIKDNNKEEAAMLVDKHLNRYRFDEAKIREEFPEYFE